MAKLCCQCGEQEAVRESRCRECANAYHREWYRRNIDKARKDQRERQRARHADVAYRCKTNERRRHRRQELRQRGGQAYEKVLHAKHAERRKHLYGIDDSQYAEMLKAQNGLCAICFRPRPLEIDHDHRKGHDSARGLLCRNCNSALGLFNDSIALLESTLGYLARFPAVK